MGNIFREYLVSPLWVDQSLGPIPRENSVTAIPFFFASIKCPSSWKITITENTRIAIIIFKIYHLLSILLYTSCSVCRISSTLGSGITVCSFIASSMIL